MIAAAGLSLFWCGRGRRERKLPCQQREAEEQGNKCFRDFQALFLFGCGDFLHVFLRIFHEVFFAIFAAHFYFLTFVDPNVRFHVTAADVFIGHDALLQRIRLGLFVGLGIFSMNGHAGDAQHNRRNQGVGEFHM